VPSLVNILLSTHNGQSYLPDLLASLLGQTHRDIHITIRDDGSTDSTYRLLSDWACARANVTLTRGDRLGPVGSFFELLSSVDPACGYYAFCDQDDVWLPSKIERAISSLEREGDGAPLLYCSAVEYVDSELRHLGYSKVPKYINFSNALVENIATGCTIVLNRQAKELVARKAPSRAVMHDAWCYLVISAFGRVIYDSKPGVRYRQHGSNVLGAGANGWQRFMRRTRRIVRGEAHNLGYRAQAAEFHQQYASLLRSTKLRMLQDFVDADGRLLKRAIYASRMSLRRQASSDTAMLRLLILLGRI
jgi:glycosyltransferase involved in cell wall biosynthesis